jgi:hypothetical protein
MNQSHVFLADLVSPFLTHSLTTLLSIHLYPPALFFPTSFLGVSPMVCRHPDVKDYIDETVDVAAKGIGDGGVKGVILELFDEDGVVQRFIFNFKVLGTVSEGGEGGGGGWKRGGRVVGGEDISLVEFGFRDILVKVSRVTRCIERGFVDGSLFSPNIVTPRAPIS